MRDAWYRLSDWPGQWIALSLVLVVMVPTDPVLAQGTPAAVCDKVAIQVAGETDVPLDVLRSITRTETGRGATDGMQPWPWTVNMEGTGVWFDTEAQAQQYVFRHFKAGARSFDIGCFQINYRWHGHAFNSIEEMFDPVLNARYAARFLQELHEEHGDWTSAVGAYHSRTRKYAQRYLARYTAVQRNLPDIADQRTTRGGTNQFPLLTGSSGQGSAGSLVPGGLRSAGSLFAPARGG